MSDVTINYKGNAIATMDASGTKTLLTEGKLCEDDIEVVYVSPGGGGISLDDYFKRTEPTGAVSLPTVTKFFGYSFYNHDLITSISAPNLTRLGAYDFYDCGELVSVNMPELLYIGENGTADANISNGTQSYAFNGCHKLENVNLPKLIKCGQNTFREVGYGTSIPAGGRIIVLPAIQRVGNSSFRQGKFTAVDIGPDLTYLDYDAFYLATVGTVILRSPTVVTANNRDSVKAITNLYVPSAIVADYATASNWVSDAGNRTVTAIEGSQYEHYYADGTPIT